MPTPNTPFKIKTAHKTPVFRMSRETYEKIHYITANFNDEWQFFCRITTEEVGEYLVYNFQDLVIPKQEVTGATTDATATDMASIVEICEQQFADPKNPDAWLDRKDELSFWGHSHVDMGVTPSATDESTFKDLRETWKDRICAMFIINRKESYTLRLVDDIRKVTYEDPQLILSSNLNRAELDELIKTRIRKKSYAQKVATDYSTPTGRPHGVYHMIEYLSEYGYWFSTKDLTWDNVRRKYTLPEAGAIGIPPNTFFTPGDNLCYRNSDSADPTNRYYHTKPKAGAVPITLTRIYPQPPPFLLAAPPPSTPTLIPTTTTTVMNNTGISITKGETKTSPFRIFTSETVEEAVLSGKSHSRRTILNPIILFLQRELPYVFRSVAPTEASSIAKAVFTRLNVLMDVLDTFANFFYTKTHTDRIRCKTELERFLFNNTNESLFLFFALLLTNNQTETLAVLSTFDFETHKRWKNHYYDSEALIEALFKNITFDINRFLKACIFHMIYITAKNQNVNIINDAQTLYSIIRLLNKTLLNNKEIDTKNFWPVADPQMASAKIEEVTRNLFEKEFFTTHRSENLFVFPSEEKEDDQEFPIPDAF